MDTERIQSIIEKHFSLIVVLVLAISPVTFYLSSLYYKSHIESLEAQVNVLHETISFLEKRLQPPNQKSSVGREQTDTSQVFVSQQLPTNSTIRYPTIVNAVHLSHLDVAKLANFYDLRREWNINPHLRFLEGDISYWYEQGLPEGELRIQFESRRLILQEAEKTGEQIPTQGDLSFKAEQIQPALRKK